MEAVMYLPLIIGALLVVVSPTAGEVACGHLPSVRFARPTAVQPSGREYKAHNHVQFVCRTGFKFDPDNQNSVTCNVDGTWTQPPNCVPVRCQWQGYQPEGGLFRIRPASQSPTSGRLSLQSAFMFPAKGATFMYKSVATLTCQIGYVVSDFRKTSTRCDETGHWQTPFPSCKRTLCTVPQPLPNSEVIGHRQPGAIVEYEDVIRVRCSQGFMLGGVLHAIQERVCIDEGRWTSIERCEPISCGAAITYNNTRLLNPQPSFHFQEEASYECDSGFHFSPPIRSTTMRSFCDARGKWTPIFACEQAQCPVLEPLLSGRIQVSGEGRRVGSVATYSCQSGSVLIGEKSRECTVEGHWTGSAPICQDCSTIIGAGNGQQPNYTSLSQRTLPWQAVLWNKRPATGQPHLICTGALVHNRMVVIAAHCLDGLTQHALRTGQVVVRYGSTSVSHERLIWQVHEHPDFDPLAMEHNIALLVLQKKVRRGTDTALTPILDSESASVRCFESSHSHKVLSNLAVGSDGEQVHHTVIQLTSVPLRDCYGDLHVSNHMCLHGTDPATSDKIIETGVAAAYTRDESGESRWIVLGLANKRLFRQAPHRAHTSITKLSSYSSWLNELISCEENGKKVLHTRCVC